MDDETVNDIASQVYELFDAIPSNGKPKGNEFTVLSAIIQEDSSHKFQIVSLTSGTKCLGKGQDNSAGNLISDSHAEVLAKRAFCRFLLKEALNVNNLSNQTSLERVPDSNRYRIKAGWKYHLFVSDSPCGDSSIYNRHNGINFTGAKPVSNKVESTIKECIDDCRVTASSSREDSQQLGIIRTKSGRSTIEEKNRTTSMSCSDKICRWIFLGCLGGILSNMIDPIYFSTIIVGADLLASTDNQMAALYRCFVERMNCFTSIDFLYLPIIKIVRFNQFTQGKCQQEYLYQIKLQHFQQSKDVDITISEPIKYVPCGTSINWIRDVMNEGLLDNVESSRKRNKSCRGGSVEVTLAHIGAMQGAVKRSIGNYETSSRLCRRDMTTLSYELYKISLLEPNDRRVDSSFVVSSNETNSSFSNKLSYLEWKKANILYQTRKAVFLDSPFRSWIVDDDQDFVVEVDFVSEENSFKKIRR